MYVIVARHPEHTDYYRTKKGTWVGPLREDFERFQTREAAETVIVEKNIAIEGRTICVVPA